jgi:hypothetical protein
MGKNNFFNQEFNAIQVLKTTILFCGFFLLIYFGNKILWYLQQILIGILGL